LIGFAALVATAAFGGAPEAPPRPPAVGVGLLEWQVAVYRASVPAGAVRLNVTNLGEDPHDLVIRTRAGRVVKRMSPLMAGRRRTVRATLGRGRYVLVCSIADHEQLGMRGRLRVTRAAG
jgi:hypothetical protein